MCVFRMRIDLRVNNVLATLNGPIVNLRVYDKPPSIGVLLHKLTHNGITALSVKINSPVFIVVGQGK